MKKLFILFLILVLFAFKPTPQDNPDKDLQQLRETAKNWAEAFNSKDAFKILYFYDLKASFEQDSSTNIIGSFLKSWEKYNTFPDYSLTWQIEDAGISKSRRFGYTTGPWQQQFTQHGKLIKSSGRYLTMWLKEKDGSWRILIDKHY
jgi:ketosteroid isomerase-like protein